MYRAKSVLEFFECPCKLDTELINEIEKCKVELHVKEVEQSEQKGSQKQEERIKQLEEKSRLDKKEMEEKVNHLSQAMEQMKSSFVSNTPNQLQGIISEENLLKGKKQTFVSNTNDSA